MSNKVIWVEDDRYMLQLGKRVFEKTGLQVIPVNRVADLEKSLTEHSGISVVILDIMMPPGNFDSFEVRAGFETGLLVAEYIKTRYPDITVIFYSAYSLDEAGGRFGKQGFRIFNKMDMSVRQLAHEVKLIIDGGYQNPRCFIVHGHNESLTLELKNFLQHSLGLPEPIILSEHPSGGKTIIEKFEEETQRVDLVFCLLTPDDVVSTAAAPNAQKRRARQNVIFEMGYFFGALRRKKGKVLLLYQGPGELPSDISGIPSIDVSNGVWAAGESIRRELAEALRWQSGIE